MFLYLLATGKNNAFMITVWNWKEKQHVYFGSKKKSRKNFKDKAEVFTDKMYDEIDNFGIYRGYFTRHHNCTVEVFEMQI